jgi:methyl-accepting chemotaxis protein
MKRDLVVGGVGVAIGVIGLITAVLAMAETAELRKQIESKPNRGECASPAALDELASRVSSAASKATDAADKADEVARKAADASSTAEDAESKARSVESDLSSHRLLGH